MTIFKKIEKFVADVFKTTLEIFLEALKLSPNAQGYVSGSITELLLKNKIEELGYEVKRIREKWEGGKHPKHHGDFYFKKKDTKNWFVLESKGIKSNSEKWHKLYNYDRLIKFLFEHNDKITWIKRNDDIEIQIKKWVDINLPKFKTKYNNTLYDYEEIHKYLKNLPKIETNKSKTIVSLSHLNRDEINEMIEERLNYLMSKIKVLETHFVSGTSGSSDRTQATPRKDEFNLISIDIFLRYSEHKFVFANPKQLESSGDDSNHMQQNYIMGFIFKEADGFQKLELTDELNENFNDVFDTLDKLDAINENDMQIDNRNIKI
ncbi:MAG: hypothetical protein M1419_06755 [Bacteroidetes bacterium]|nr:hypothetical protein [Bacteroidota bacterium]